MKPLTFAYQELTRVRTFQPREGKSQDLRQHANGLTSYVLQINSCLTEKKLRLDCS